MAPDLTLLDTVAYRGRDITSPRLRDLLAVLAGDVATGASGARLIEELWPDEQPENPGKALQILVSRARSQLGSNLIITTPTGTRSGCSKRCVSSVPQSVRTQLTLWIIESNYPRISGQISPGAYLP